VLEIVECARQVTGRTIAANIGKRRPGDHPRLVADYKRAQDMLGWTPVQSNIDSIIRSAWKWHLSHPSGYSK
jgi:UDP-glucose 4-epimerase